MRVRDGGLFVAALLAAAPVGAVEVQRSVEVAAPPEEVWAAIGEICAIVAWRDAPIAGIETVTASLGLIVASDRSGRPNLSSSDV